MVVFVKFKNVKVARMLKILPEKLLRIIIGILPVLMDVLLGFILPSV